MLTFSTKFIERKGDFCVFLSYLFGSIIYFWKKDFFKILRKKIVSWF